MEDNLKKYQIEYERIKNQIEVKEQLKLGRVEFIVTLNNEFNIFISDLKSILLLIDKSIIDNKRLIENIEYWQTTLPEKLITSFRSELTNEESDAWIKKWRTLSVKEKAKEEKNLKWTLSNWIYWFSPENKTWIWYSYQILKKNKLSIVFEVEDMIVPFKALSWLMELLGAKKIEIKNI